MKYLVEMQQVRNAIGKGATHAELVNSTKLSGDVVSIALASLQRNNMIRYNKSKKIWRLAW